MFNLWDNMLDEVKSLMSASVGFLKHPLVPAGLKL